MPGCHAHHQLYRGRFGHPRHSLEIGLSEKRLKMPFGQASHPKKDPDGAGRIAADLHTVSPTLIFRWTYTLTGKNIPHILLPAKSNTLSNKQIKHIKRKARLRRLRQGVVALHPQERAVSGHVLRLSHMLKGSRKRCLDFCMRLINKGKSMPAHAPSRMS